MTHYLLDTNHISPLVTFHHPLRRRVFNAIRAGDLFSITTVSLTESLFGLHLTPRAKQNLAEWRSIKDGFIFLEVTVNDAERAADLQASLRRKGWQLKTVDAIIAAIAIRNNLTLLTTDGNFNRVPNLSFENWL